MLGRQRELLTYFIFCIAFPITESWNSSELIGFTDQTKTVVLCGFGWF